MYLVDTQTSVWKQKAISYFNASSINPNICQSCLKQCVFFLYSCIKPAACFAGAAGLYCDGSGLALLEPLCVISVALLGSIHLIPVHEDDAL